jgi:hypothetical protein
MYLKKDFPRWEIISSLLFDFSRITMHLGINEQIQKEQRICHLSSLVKILYFKLSA